MARINTAIRFVPTAASKPQNLFDLTRTFRGRDNAAFLASVARRLKAAAKKPGPAGTVFDPNGIACIGLIGEYGLLTYGIRQAQELIRLDHSPSYWSHAFLITSPLSVDEAVNRDRDRSAWIWESTLEPASIFNHFVDRNGVGPRRIADYARAGFGLFAEHSVPNFAVLAIALTPAERAAIVNRADDPDVDQLHYDISGLLGTWYAYLTNRASHANPLSDGHAIYCSAYVQLAYEAAGIDLAPGAHQRNTAPEHLWQAFKYFQAAFQIRDPASGKLVPRPMLGYYCVRDRACVIAPVEINLPRNLRGIVGELESQRSSGAAPAAARAGKRRVRRKG
jgi:hypothetical protein